MRNILQLPNLAEIEARSGDESDPSAPTRDSGQKLLNIVLALAIKDNASSVHYHIWRDDAMGEGTLYYVIGGVCYEMVPPPLEIVGALFAAGRRLLASRGLWGSLRRLLGRALGSCSGQFSLLDTDGRGSEWCGAVWSAGKTAGLDFYRYDPPVPLVGANAGRSDAQRGEEVGE